MPYKFPPIDPLDEAIRLNPDFSLDSLAVYLKNRQPGKYKDPPMPPASEVTSRMDRLELILWRAAHRLRLFRPEESPLANRA